MATMVDPDYGGGALHNALMRFAELGACPAATRALKHAYCHPNASGLWYAAGAQLPASVFDPAVVALHKVYIRTPGHSDRRVEAANAVLRAGLPRHGTVAVIALLFFPECEELLKLPPDTVRLLAMNGNGPAACIYPAALVFEGDSRDVMHRLRGRRSP